MTYGPVRSAVTVVLLVVFAGIASAQVGQPLPEADFKNFTQSGAREFSDFDGRLVLIEVFAHW